jgi:hypothetical protein
MSQLSPGSQSTDLALFQSMPRPGRIIRYGFEIAGIFIPLAATLYFLLNEDQFNRVLAWLVGNSR